MMLRRSLFVILSLVLSMCWVVHPVQGQLSPFLHTQTKPVMVTTKAKVDSPSSTTTETETRDLIYIPKFRPGTAASATKGVLAADNNDDTNEEPPLWAKIVGGFVMVSGFIGIIWCCTRCVRKCTELEQTGTKAIAPLEVVPDEEEATCTGSKVQSRVTQDNT